MRIAFLDNTGWDYTPLTPLAEPLGGSQSALCYLAMALAKRGHHVALANHTGNPGIHGGVECLGAERSMNAEYLNGFDMILSIVASGQSLRASGVRVPMMLWAHHDIGQPAVACLKEAQERDCWNGFAMVSHWQASRYVSAFQIPPARITIKRNAASPAFEVARPHQPYWFETGQPPLLAYASTPFRGLELLLTAFPTIRAAMPGARLHVYSGMGIYRVGAAADDEYQLLYELCRALEGAEYRGPVSQTILADELTEADMLAYPSTFAETSCITAMEAMAAGCLIMTTALGALPETLGRFGHMHTPSKPNPEPLEFATGYCRQTIALLADAVAKPAEYRAALDAQSGQARTELTWDRRALEWEGMLNAIIPKQPGSP